MKIRNGFVSNSSASSFLIYGLEIDSTDLEEILRGKMPKKDNNDDIDIDIYEELDDIIPSKSQLKSYSPESCGVFYIGCSWDNIDDNETGKQFKERVEKEIRDLIIGDLWLEKMKFGTHEYAWRDG